MPGRDSPSHLSPSLSNVSESAPVNLETLECLLRARRSTRAFSTEKVSAETVELLLRAATRGPSAHNAQPWRFAVVTTSTARQRLAAGLTAHFQIDLEAAATPRSTIHHRVSAARRLLLAPPVVIAVCLSMDGMDPYDEPPRKALEHVLAVQSVACATMLVLLAAETAGLASCWVSAPLFAPEAVTRSLDLPADWEPQALVLLGHAEGRYRTTDRKRVDEVSIWR